MRMLLTGGTGFVGKNVLGALVRKGHTVATLDRGSPVNMGQVSFGIDADSVDQSINRAFESFRPEVVIHLAAKWRENSGEVGSGDLNDYIKTNVTFGMKVLQNTLNVNARFINIASYWQLPLDEFELRNNPYVQTKNAFKFSLEKLSQIFPGKITNIFLFDNYGPSDPRLKVITKLLESGVTNTEIKLRSPNVNLNLLYIDDVAEGISVIANLDDFLSNYEISAESNIRLWQCVEGINEVLEIKQYVSWQNQELEDVSPNSHMRIFPLPPGWSQTTNFQEGIRKMIK